MPSEFGLPEFNGARLAYEVAGTGEPIVLLHGFSFDRRMWDDQVPALAERQRVIRYDPREFGQSTVPGIGEPYSHIDDLTALLDQLGVEQRDPRGSFLRRPDRD